MVETIAGAEARDAATDMEVLVFALGAEDGKADADSQGDDRGKRNDEESHDACPPNAVTYDLRLEQCTTGAYGVRGVGKRICRALTQRDRWDGLRQMQIGRPATVYPAYRPL